ncbi:MAG: cation transporter [Ruminococcaceae bacterium]|nr:cation transporter [Oscillospiraceae bacterium]
MNRYIVRLFVRNDTETNNPAVRAAYGKLAGLVGILCNVLLFGLKIWVGLISGSVAVLSDAFNNLSDMGTSVVSLIGTSAANRRADEDHPFGHGRSEYIAALIVSFFIMLVGFELLRSSVTTIFQGKNPVFDLVTVAVMAASILVKLWMFSFYRFCGKKIQSPVLQAAAADSVNDVYATSAVVLALFVSRFVSIPVDGLMGLAVSVLIMITGYRLARDTITVLLGTAPDPMLSETICDMILEQEGIIGVHDLVLHDYGPGRCLASVHAEVSAHNDIVTIHNAIDAAEKRIERETGVHIVIHMDPMGQGDETEAIRHLVLDCVHKVNPVFGIHDFQIVEQGEALGLLFDLEVPYSMKQAERDAAIAQICALIHSHDERFVVTLRVDNKK